MASERKGLSMFKIALFFVECSYRSKYEIFNGKSDLSLSSARCDSQKLVLLGDFRSQPQLVIEDRSFRSTDGYDKRKFYFYSIVRPELKQVTQNTANLILS